MPDYRFPNNCKKEIDGIFGQTWTSHLKHLLYLYCFRQVKMFQTFLNLVIVKACTIPMIRHMAGTITEAS